MSGDGVNLRKALEQTFSAPVGPRIHWFFACGCTFAETCADCERKIDAADYEARYGDPDSWDPGFRTADFPAGDGDE